MKPAKNNHYQIKGTPQGFIFRLYKRGQKRDLNYVRTSSFVAGLIYGAFGMVLILVVC